MALQSLLPREPPALVGAAATPAMFERVISDWRSREPSVHVLRKEINVLKDLERRLERNGCVLVRARRHRIWRTPSGRVLVLPSTPSDRRAERNCLAEARRAGVDL